MGLIDKFETTKQLGNIVTSGCMPGGRKMSASELSLMKELLEWCNYNCFFDITPKYDTPKMYS